MYYCSNSSPKPTVWMAYVWKWHQCARSPPHRTPIYIISSSSSCSQIFLFFFSVFVLVFLFSTFAITQSQTNDTKKKWALFFCFDVQWLLVLLWSLLLFTFALSHRPFNHARTKHLFPFLHAFDHSLMSITARLTVNSFYSLLSNTQT